MARFAETWKRLVAEDWPLPFVLIDAAGLDRGADDIPAGLFSELECLFTGELAQELRHVAPYLGRVAGWNDGAEQSIAALIEKDAAMLALSANAALTLSQLRRHLRKFNLVYGPDGKPLFFRYYDPRVIVDVLSVLEPTQLEAFFGPIEAFIVQDAARNTVHYYRQDDKLASRA